MENSKDSEYLVHANDCCFGTHTPIIVLGTSHTEVGKIVSKWSIVNKAILADTKAEGPLTFRGLTFSLVQ
jgi:hypothetical protein